MSAFVFCIRGIALTVLALLSLSPDVLAQSPYPPPEGYGYQGMEPPPYRGQIYGNFYGPARFSGPPQGYVPRPPQAYGSYAPVPYRGYQGYSGYRGTEGYAPAGTMIDVSLSTSISTQVAKPGDFIRATVSKNVPLGGVAYIPAGTVVTGEVTSSKKGGFFTKSGLLSIQFNEMQLQNGMQVPFSATVVGNIGKWKEKGDTGTYRGEGTLAKLASLGIRGLVGAGAGAALGTGIGAIAGESGTATGRGAWSGAAIGGGVGAVSSLIRRGRNIIIPTGTEIQLQLTQPLSLPAAQAQPMMARQPLSEPYEGQRAMPLQVAPGEPGRLPVTSPYEGQPGTLPTPQSVERPYY